MKSVDDHLTAILDAVSPLSPLEVLLGEAHGCVLAETVVAEHPLPGFDNSAMDGYAVRQEELRGASRENPVTLTVSGEVAAGAAPALRVAPGFCARIMTGGMVPPGADAVVPQEWTDEGTDTVRIYRVPQAGECVRRAGEDLAAGDVVLTEGTPLGAAQVGLLAAAGRQRARVRPRPRVVVLSTGTELREPGQPLRPGEIYDSNSYALAAAAREAGALAFRVEAVPDEPDRLRETLDDHLIHADAVVTSGGVSVGAHDIVKQVLSRGGTVTFDRVAMQPGMPQGFGRIGPEQTPIFTLPGNPVSALVSFEVFVRPALRRMLGAEPILRPHLSAAWAGGDWASPEGRRQYVRVTLQRAAGGGYEVRPVGPAGSHLLAGLVAANALAVLGEAAVAIRDGTQVSVMLLERRGR